MPSKQSHRTLLALSAAALALTSHAQYLAYDLGVGTANHINSSRTVVGNTYRNGVQLAYALTGDVMTMLGTLPGADFSIAYCINDLGAISGSSGGNSTAGYLQGFVWQSGVMSPIGTLGSHTYAAALNNQGTIVGESTLPNGLSHAFSYSDGVITDLGTFGGRFSLAHSLNSSGVIVGHADLPSSTHAFRYSNGTMTDLGSLDGGVSYATDINDAGTIVGYSSVGGSGGYEHAFRYHDDIMTDLGLLGPGPFGSSEANAINSFGAIVGTSDAWDGKNWTRHAFLYRDGVMTDLSPWLAPVGLDQLSIAEDINDNGDIVGYALDADGIGHGFLLLVPEPSTTALFALGLLLLSSRRLPRHALL